MYTAHPHTLTPSHSSPPLCKCSRSSRRSSGMHVSCLCGLLLLFLLLLSFSLPLPSLQSLRQSLESLTLLDSHLAAPQKRWGASPGLVPTRSAQASRSATSLPPSFLLPPSLPPSSLPLSFLLSLFSVLKCCVWLPGQWQETRASQSTMPSVACTTSLTGTRMQVSVPSRPHTLTPSHPHILTPSPPHSLTPSQ